tara:strand:+ start:657 stop:806 length:150 start_codon:yes stop_codon:yes gene_type:complete
MKKIIQGGDYFAHQNETRSQEKNLKWFASSTHYIKNIPIEKFVLATLEQ